MNQKNEEFTPTANEIAALFRQFGQFAYENSLVAQTKFSELYQCHVKSHLDKEIHRFIYDIVNREIASDQLAEGLKAGLFLAYLEFKNFWGRILPDNPFDGMVFKYFLQKHFFKIFGFFFHDLVENDYNLPSISNFPTPNLYANWFLIWITMDKKTRENIKWTGDYNLFFREIDFFYSHFDFKILAKKYFILEKEYSEKTMTWGRKDIKISKNIISETKRKMAEYPNKSTSVIMKEICLKNKLSENALMKWWSNNYRRIIRKPIRNKYYGKGKLPSALKVFERLTNEELFICFKQYLIKRGIDKKN